MGTRRVRQWLPPQHGAWAMLLVPFAAGLLTAGFRWLDLPLLGAWLAGYLCSYFALLAVKTRRPRRQVAVYGALTAALAAPVLLARPDLLRFAAVYAPLIAVNVVYAARRRERALVNDLASVAQSCVMVFVVAAVASVPLQQVAVPFLVVLAYFTGTVLYVKTMIRERGSRGYRIASVACHVLALAGAVVLGPLSAAVFALLLARAWLLPGRRLTPKQVGLAEIAASALVLTTAALA
ncbi:YwiC-like family protein [Dactylosporangium sp. AC04546]|uniref:YwiC-like family protein n=1 Tax=Dactylosporangium sp. AC04546 TaxID=2862460 RepID=UPI001EDDA535|nr:YwiC-like family protein [Dactylosporangium sp. AC04546]WVK88562.1 YwiC-like family protein [Dactylosporangium sp. AC04546]